VALLWANLFGDFHLLDSSALGTLGGAALGVLVYELFHYGYHRAAHQWNWLWRTGHQMHHSAESLDAFGAYYLHPIDAAMFTTWSSLVLFPLLGVTPEAGVLGALFVAFNGIFQHANLNTPYWLGYLIQRPESHAIHHGRGIHRYNYADLPLIDMLFGTFRNPRGQAVEHLPVGFYDGGASGRRTPGDPIAPHTIDPGLAPWVGCSIFAILPAWGGRAWAASRSSPGCSLSRSPTGPWGDSSASSSRDTTGMRSRGSLCC
jgi:hypothetical protein